MNHSEFSIPFKSALVYLASLAFALSAPVPVDHLLSVVYHLHSVTAVTRREWAVSIFIPGIAGFIAAKKWNNRAAMWIWVFPFLIFAVRLVSIASSVPGISATLAHFSGAECIYGVRSSGCRDFLVFTIALVRTLAFSAGAGLFFRSGKTTTDVLQKQDASS